MTRHFAWSGKRADLAVYVSSTEPKPQVQEDADSILFVHGRSPNVERNNYTDLNNLQGNFNLIAIRKDTETVEFLKDFCNSLDAFIYEDANEIVFTSNPLLIDPGGLTLDDAAVAQYLLSYQGFWPDNYFFKEVKKVPRGSIIKIQPINGTVEIQKRVVQPRIQRASYEGFVENFNEIVRANSQGIYDGTATADLTGGYDSRLVVACLLHNTVPFRAAVYGENDAEVRFVKSMGRQLGIPVEVIEIGNEIDRGCRDWKRLFWLSGGSYNLFEVIKEGTRATERTRAGRCHRFTGGIGEVLRDKWCVDGLMRSRFERQGLSLTIERKLISMPKEPYDWCHEAFQPRLNRFLDSFRDSINGEVGKNADLDAAQCFMNAVFERYICGWLGTLYGFHSNMMTITAPYLDSAFLTQCSHVDSAFRSRGSGMTRAVVHYWPPFARVPYIDGHRCRRPQGLEAIRFYYSHYVSLLKKRILKETQKVEYDHAAWLRLLMQDAEFRESIVSQHDWFPTLISHGAFGKLLSLGEAGQLSRSNFDFLWKLLSLKLTLSFRQ